MKKETALRILLEKPVTLAKWCGYPKLQEELHGPWLREMLMGQGDMTLLAHRCSYKTTCLAMALAVQMVARPQQSILLMRKTDEDAAELLRQVKLILLSQPFQALTKALYGEPVHLTRAAATELTCSCYAAPRGAAQLIGSGTGAGVTGKHAEIIFTDDIVNLQDRLSAQERRRTRSVYMELQNVRVPGGRIINLGTPWHPDDALSLMPEPMRYDCYRTGLLTSAQIERLRGSMSPSLFAANYELRHVARDGALFAVPPSITAEVTKLYDGVAHVDAAYGGSDFTALTCAQRRGGKIYLYGRLWPQHVDTVMEEIMAEMRRLRCGPLYCETNADKGYVAREFRARGAPVRCYTERENKHLKIATWLRKWWPHMVIVEGTDPRYLAQILDYTEDAAHDDAPDSAACLCRVLDRRS